MLLLNCENCGMTMTRSMGSVTPENDCVLHTLQCWKCKAIYRVSVTLLRGGNSVATNGTVETYDKDGGRVPIKTPPTTPRQGSEVTTASVESNGVSDTAISAKTS